MRMSETAFSAMLTFSRGSARARSSIYYTPSLSALQSFAAVIQGYSDAAVERLSFVTSFYTDNQETTGDNPFGLSGYADIRLVRKSKQAGSGNYRAVHVLCPKTSMLEESDSHYRVKKAVGEAIATAYSTMVGETFVFDSGWVCGGYNQDQDAETGG
jgi:hypothetical protein